MKKILLLLPIIAILFLVSCDGDEINNYYDEDSKIEKFVVFQQPIQVIEERRDQMNTKIMYSENDQIPGRIEINFINPETGAIEYSTERILLDESGYIETGKTTALDPGIYIIEIKNVTENSYAYNFGGSENYEDSSKIFDNFEFIASPLEFTYESVYPESMQSGNFELSARETITVSGGYVKLIGVNFYKKSDDIDSWNLYHHSNIVSQSYGTIGSVNNGNIEDWEEDGGYYYSSIEGLNVQFWGNNETHVFYIYDSLKGISEEIEIEYYTEYIFEDQWDTIVKFQTEPHEVDIEESEPMTEVDFDTNEIDADDYNDWQLGLEIEANVNMSLQVERLDIYKDMNTNPWNVFSAIKVVNDQGVILAYNMNLGTQSEWNTVSYGYKFRINGIADVINVGNELEYRIYYKLQPGVGNINIDTFVEGRYTTEDGITHYFETEEEELEIED